MTQRLVWMFYQCLVRCYVVCIWLYLLFRSIKQPEYRRFWNERMGRVVWRQWQENQQDQAKPLKETQHNNPTTPVIWIHAVSVGEARSVKPLIDHLLETLLDLTIVLTHHTPTARQISQDWVAQHRGRLRVCYAPYDTMAGYRRWLSSLHVLGVLRACILIENQVWPNLTRYLKQQKVPVLVVNGRCSKRSFQKLMQSKWLGWLRRLAKLTFSNITWIGAQSKDDAQRFLDLGANRVQVMRNLKFDIEPNLTQIKQGQSVRQLWREQGIAQVCVLASSREGEELAFLKAYRRWLDALNSQKRQTNQMLSVIVPRHPERFDEIANIIESQGFVLYRASDISWQTFHAFDQSDQPVVILGDDMGRMAFWYALADAVLMGGSWEKFGGQNLIEPLQQGTPVWLGVHTFNFAEVSRRAVEAGVAFVCDGKTDDSPQRSQSEHALFQALCDIQTQQGAIKNGDYQARSAHFVEQYKGGSKRLVKVIRLILEL